MPKLNLPGGKGGGSKSVTLSPSCELKQIGGAWIVCPSAKFISDCKEQGRSEVTRQIGSGYGEAHYNVPTSGYITLDGGDYPLRTGPVRTAEYTGYGISRPVPCPKALSEAPASPVQRVYWWEEYWFPLVCGIGVLVILAAMAIMGVGR